MIPYFRGLQFVTYGNSVNYSGVCAKHFAGYYGIQYCHHGSFYLALDHNEPVIYNGPHALSLIRDLILIMAVLVSGIMFSVVFRGIV